MQALMEEEKAEKTVDDCLKRKMSQSEAICLGVLVIFAMAALFGVLTALPIPPNTDDAFLRHAHIASDADILDDKSRDAHNFITWQYLQLLQEINADFKTCTAYIAAQQHHKPAGDERAQDVGEMSQ